MKGIPTSDQAAALALAAKVDASLGFPRCDRLSATIVARVPITCPCTKANAPDARCSFSTRTQLDPIQTDTAWAYPLDNSKPEILAPLSASEKSAITDVAPKSSPVVSAAVAADASADAPVKP